MTYWTVVLCFGVIINLSRAHGLGPCVLVESIPSSLCIPLGVINEAFLDARHRVGLYEPYTGPLLNQHNLDKVDKLGLAITETTRVLARKFNLNHQQVFHFMPKLDLSLTEIWKFCPAHFRHKICEMSRFRSISGHCNNLRHPDWGATFVPFQNILPPHHPDGISEPRGYEHGYLPSPRVVSSTMHRDAMVHDHAITIMLIAWGQIIDHDITLTGDTKDPYTLKDPDCCSNDLYGTHHHNCFPIKLPDNDPFYSHYGQHCMNFARSLSAVRSDCRLGTRKAFNKITSFLDASFVYGSDDDLGSNLRLGKHGLLRSLPIFEHLRLKDLLPLKMEEPDDGCIRHNKDVFCFNAGDVRVNEQLVLTVLHTIFMREHNRIAHILGSMNSHWDDERIFQETRQIIIAITQHITFQEFLPMILGKYVMQDYGLTLQKEDYWAGYDPTVDATAAEEFVTSAFRFGHSLLPTRIERWSHGHKFIGSEDLHKLIRQPFDVYRPGYIDTFILGMVNQLAQAMDEGVTEQVTTLLFKEPHLPFGMDLAAMNIQRGREHGVNGYSSYREICGLTPISSWDDLTGVMRNETIYRYKSIYKTPHDIDLWSGGVSELPGKGSLLGPTFSCIIARQFRALRYGDRFWYELPDLASSFTPDQLQEIRNIRLSRLLCDNSDDVKTIQIYAMVLPDAQINPRVACKADIIPRIDLEKWREIPGVTDVDELHNINAHVHDQHQHEHEHEHEHPLYNNYDNYDSFEYQHEHEVEQIRPLTYSTPMPSHAYGYDDGYGTSQIRASDIDITTPAPPPLIVDYQPVKKVLHKHTHRDPNPGSAYVESNRGYDHGYDYGYDHSGIQGISIDITTPAPPQSANYRPVEKVLHTHKHRVPNPRSAYGESNHGYEHSPGYGYDYGYGSDSEMNITTPAPYLDTGAEYQSVEKVFHKPKHQNPKTTPRIQLPMAHMESNRGYGHGYGYEAITDYEVEINHPTEIVNHHYHYPRNFTSELRHIPMYLSHEEGPTADPDSHSTLTFPEEADKGDPLLNVHLQKQKYSGSVGINSYSKVPKAVVVHLPLKQSPPVRIISRPPPKSKKFQPFPDSPFPGWSGIFSPNPGYLVKQRFQVYRPPAPYIVPQKAGWKGMIG